MEWLRNNKPFVIAMVLVLIMPVVLTCHSLCSCFDFSGTGQIGDTIGGVTAPIIGLISVYLLVRTLNEQLTFNKLQATLQKDEQFRATLFQLMKDQREIAQSLSVSYHCLTKKTTKETKVSLEGYKFFRAARYELSLIFSSMDLPYRSNYDPDEISDWMDNIYNSLYTGTNLPLELKEENKEIIDEVKKAALKAYTIDKYGISEEQHQSYQTLTCDKKIKFVYNIFFSQHENCGVYFRHLYHILDFIDRSKEQELNELSEDDENVMETKRNEILKRFYDYAQFVQAQMSSNELLLLYYNIFSFPKTKELVIRYNIIENLTLESLIAPQHHCDDRIKLKMRSV